MTHTKSLFSRALKVGKTHCGVGLFLKFYFRFSAFFCSIVFSFLVYCLFIQFYFLFFFDQNY